MNQTFWVKDFINPSEKDAAWAYNTMTSYYLFGQAKCLLPADWELIQRYAEGDQPMDDFKDMFKKIREEATNHESNPLGYQPTDLTGIDFEPLGILAQPIQSAINLLKKQPIYVKATCIDQLAYEKKQQDFDFLKNRSILESDLDAISAALKMKLEVPKPANNTENVDIANFGLDPNKEDELQLFIQLFHKLPPESAMEVVIYALSYLRNYKQIRDLQSKDQFYFGVSAQMCDYSAISGIPDCSYIPAEEVFTPDSKLPDYSDQPFRYRKYFATYEQLADKFGDELIDDLESVFESYWKSREDKISTIEDLRMHPGKYSVPLVYMEFKSWDVIKFHKKKTATGNINEIVDYTYELKYSNRYPDRSLRGQKKKASEEEYISPRYVQNTYTGYFFPFLETGTASSAAKGIGRVYRYQKLNKAYREAGREALSKFSIDIYRTATQSPAKLCMPIVKDVQRAYLKLQQCIIAAKPKGAFIDFKFIRNAALNLSSTDFKMSIKELLNMFVDKNIIIGDSEGYESDYNTSKPYQEIPGGLGNEVAGFYQVINDGYAKIGKITGTEGISGQSTNPDSLVGTQKLMLQSSVNSIYHIQEGSRLQTECCFRSWSSIVQMLLKNRGSAPAKAIETIIGNYKADALSYLHTIPSHVYSILVEAAPTEQEQAELNNILLEMFHSQTITGADYFSIKRIFNTKDAQLLLGIRNRKAMEEQRAARQEAGAAQMQAAQMKIQSDVEKTKYSADGEVKEEQVKAESARYLADFNSRFEVMKMQMMGEIKKMLQDDRVDGQIKKAAHAATIDAQKPLT